MKYNILALFVLNNEVEDSFLRSPVAYDSRHTETRNKLIEEYCGYALSCRYVWHNISIRRGNEEKINDNARKIFDVLNDDRVVATCIEFYPEYIKSVDNEIFTLPFKNEHFEQRPFRVKKFLYANYFSFIRGNKSSCTFSSVGRGRLTTLVRGTNEMDCFIRENTNAEGIVDFNRFDRLTDLKRKNFEDGKVRHISFYEPVGIIAVEPYEANQYLLKIPVMSYYKLGGDKKCGEK